ncbi:hypothetical protein [Streptosporangium sp. NPDC002524]|uniref:hypothetical protein n=1 Tax=Streptosporangium sp. NPDC002524 TaxID=3154537 RepID=UPI003323F6F8
MNGGRDNRRRIAVAVLVAVLGAALIAVVAGALGALVSNTFGVDRETTSTVSIVVSGLASGVIAAILVRRYRPWPKASDTRPKLDARPEVPEARRPEPSDVSERVSGSPERT